MTYKATARSSCNCQALEATAAQTIGDFEAVSLAFRCSKLSAGAVDEHDKWGVRGVDFASWGKRRLEHELHTDLGGVAYPVRESERPPSGYAQKPPLVRPFKIQLFNRKGLWSLQANLHPGD